MGMGVYNLFFHTQIFFFYKNGDFIFLYNGKYFGGVQVFKFLWVDFTHHDTNIR